MVASIQQMLAPILYSKTISVVSGASSWLLNFFGMQVGGPNERYYGDARSFGYKVFNNVRNAAAETAPDAPAARRARLPVGDVMGTYPRMYESFSLDFNELENLSKIDDPRMRDVAAESYIARQSIAPGQRHGNWRAALLVGMLRDSLYLHESGSQWYPTYSSTSALIRRNFNVPSGNLSQGAVTDFSGNGIFLNAGGTVGDIITLPWTNPGANIPLHVLRMDEALYRRHGVHLKHIICRSLTWNNITSNDYVATGAGIANPPFQTFTRNVGQNPDGTPIQVWAGTVNTIPGITFWINNDGRDLGLPGSETFQYDIEGGKILAIPEPTGELFEGRIGSETVIEYDNGPKRQQVGYGAWTKLASDPARYQSFQMDNFMPCPYMPGSWLYLDVNTASSNPALET